MTATLDPSSVAAGGTATLTVSASETATPGIYTVTVTGTEGSFTRTATVTAELVLQENVPLLYRAAPAGDGKTRIEGVLWAEPSTTFTVEAVSRRPRARRPTASWRIPASSPRSPA